MFSFEQSIRFLDLPRLDRSICQEIVTAAEKINTDFEPKGFFKEIENSKFDTSKKRIRNII